MKINTAYQLQDFNGPMFEPGESGPVPITIAKLIPHVYAASHPQERIPDPEMLRRYEMAAKFVKPGIVETTSEEIALLKKCVRIAYNHPGLVIPFERAVEGPALVVDLAAVG